MQTWRYLLAASTVVFVISVAIQFYFIGVALTQLGGNGNADLHITFGYWLPMIPLLSLILCWPARAGGRMALWVAVLFVDTFVQGILPSFRDSVAPVAALHPVNALVIAGLGGYVARRAIALARAELSAGEPASPAQTAPQS